MWRQSLIARVSSYVILVLFLASHSAAAITLPFVQTPQSAQLDDAKRQEGEGDRLIAKRDFREGLEAYKRALAIRQAVLGPSHSLVARSWLTVSLAHSELLQTRECVAAFENAVSILERNPNPDLRELGRRNYELGSHYLAGGDYVNAEARFLRALEILKRVPKLPAAEIEPARLQLSQIYALRGEYVRAEALVTTCIQNYEVAYGKDCYEILEPLIWLRAVYLKSGDTRRGESVTRRAMAIAERANGSPGVPSSESLEILADYLWSIRDDEAVEPVIRQCLDLLARESRPSPYREARMRGRLRYIIEQKGLIDEAEKYVTSAVEANELAGSDDVDALADSLLNLALFYSRTRRNLDKVEGLILRAVSMVDKEYGTDSLANMKGRQYLISYYFNVGNVTREVELFRSQVEIGERHYLPDSLELAALFDAAEGKSDEPGIDAVAMLNRSIRIKERQLGPRHPSVAASLVRLGNSLIGSDPSAAITCFAKAVQIYSSSGKEHEPELVMARLRLAKVHLNEHRYDESEKVLKETVGGVTSEGIESSRLLIASVLASARGDLVSAVRLRREYWERSDNALSPFLLLGTEREKLNVANRLSVEVPFALDLVDRAPDNSEAVRLAASAVLLGKGRVLDALILGRSRPGDAESAEFRQARDRLIAARNRVATLEGRLANAVDPARIDGELRALRGEIGKLEEELSSQDAAARLGTGRLTLDSIQASIPADTALVEFISFALPGEKFRTWRPTRYGAIVLRRTGEPAWIDLGERTPIDDAISAFQRTLRSPGSSLDSELKPAAQRLYRQVFAPIRERIGDATRVIVAPDGALSLVPFGALVDEGGKFVVERLDVTYVSSGRDLVRPKATTSKFSNPIVVADPDFGAPKAGASNIAGLAFSALPGTADEGARVGKLLASSPLTGSQATESSLKLVNGPTILHVATHGFFVSGSSTGPELTRGIVKIGEPAEIAAGSGPSPGSNPLDASLRAGIALAGANNGVSGTDDGILTAVEASELNLTGTQLVVLSACETGVGEIQDGEGVFGLRRALAIAGAESQMLSLWKVDDAGTRDLMVGFYTRLTSGAGRGDALRQTQLAMLANPALAHPYYWASFILAGDSGPVVLKRRPLIM